MSLYVGDRQVCRFGWNPNLHTWQVTYIVTRRRINTIDSPDDEHRDARNM